MSEEARRRLCKLIGEDKSLLGDVKRCRGYLMDSYKNEYKREQNVLLTA